MMRDILVEVRPHLRACQFFITCQEPIADKVQLNVKENVVSIKINQKEYTIICNSLQIIPQSITGLTLSGSSLNFRVQIESEAKKPHVPEDRIVVSPPVQANTQYKMQCLCCKADIVPLIEFNRVLPLPSTQWGACDMFCHKPKDSDDDSVLTPAVTECFYGLFFVLLNNSLLEEKNSKIVKCPKCYNWLGTRSNQIKLWTCGMKFIRCDMEETVLYTPLQQFCSIVQDAISETIGVFMCRLLFECKVSSDESQYLLLWVMDKQLTVLKNDHSLVANSGNETTEQIVTLAETKSIKLLYSYYASKNEEVTVWEEDVNVQQMEIGYQICIEGLKYLISRTKQIPSPFHMVNDFFVAYLEF